MLGYIVNKEDYFKGNLLEFNLKKAVSFSGGNQQHYNFFKAILNYSIINKSTKNPLHDAKAGEFSLHLFPLNIQCLLSIVFYKYEENLIKEFSASSLELNNILLPSDQLLYNSIITNNNVSAQLLNIVDETILGNLPLTILFDYLNINNKQIELNNNVINDTYNILSIFNINSIFIEDYINIIKGNNRLKCILLTAKALNYKPQSFQYLTEVVTTWHQTSSI
jgi:hypothetical protein